MKKYLHISKDCLLGLITFSLFIPTLLLIIFGTIWTLPEFDLTERRKLVNTINTPKNFQEMKIFRTSFNEFYNDQFVFRETLTQLANNFLFELDATTINSVFIGKSPWLFQAKEKAMEPYQNENFLSQDDMEYWYKHLKQRHDWLKEQGIAYLFVIVPNKHTVYKEQLPKTVQASMKFNNRKKLLDYLNSKNEFSILDLSDTLISHKNDYAIPLYEYTGSHWNTFGANIANDKILEYAKQLINIEPINHNPALFSYSADTTHEYAMWLGQEDQIFDYSTEPNLTNQCQASEYIENPFDICVSSFWDWCKPQKITCSENEKTTAGKSALVLHDSFYIKLRPLFAPSFSESVYLLHKDDFDALQHYTNTYKPDIVIEELLEQYLFRIPTR